MAPHALTVQQEGCDPFIWSISDDAAWLQMYVDGEVFSSQKAEDAEAEAVAQSAERLVETAAKGKPNNQ